MAYQYPEALNRLIHALATLPGVGQKAAARMAFALLTEPKIDAAGLARAIADAEAAVHPCPVCGNFTDRPRCPICEDPERDRSLLTVVETVSDLISLERSGLYRGLYHVLGGVISPLDGVGPDRLRVRELLARLEKGAVRELIMATNPTPEGEATAEYLARRVKRPGLTVTRLAHGMPVGGSLAFVDEATLDLALTNRKEL